MAIAGVLVAAAPQAHAAEKTPAKATTVTEQQARTDALVKRAQPVTRTYTVRSGDTLSLIAERYYHNAGDWSGSTRRTSPRSRTPTASTWASR